MQSEILEMVEIQYSQPSLSIKAPATPVGSRSQEEKGRRVITYKKKKVSGKGLNAQAGPLNADVQTLINDQQTQLIHLVVLVIGINDLLDLIL